ncbi:MAG: efflux RND transporter periplasmic adaptor subunit [Thermoanaerobaculales bacterium]|nr:efflux RND transporter periplasmic adaptor subunit [Thermoanaerobaculales bacterium]
MTKFDMATDKRHPGMNSEETVEISSSKMALVIVLGIAVLSTGCGGGDASSRTFEQGGGETDEERKIEAIPVEVAALESGRIEATLRFSATLEAERDVQVFAEATRRVVNLLVEEGDTVTRDQLLVRLQDEEQRSALAKASSQLAQREREFNRQKSLFDQKLVSEQVFIDAEYQFDQASIALEDAKRELDYTEVRAPISGVVTERSVNLGDFVSVNQSLFRIVDFDSIVARIYVPEQELPRLERRQPARLTADALGGLVFSGDIDRISPVVDPGTGTIKVTVATPRQKGLRPGMYVQVELVTAVHDEAIRIPKKALVYDNDQIFVFRLGEERTVERLPITAALEDTEYMEPTEGLALGDEIVIAGQSGLKDGAKVRLPGDPEPEDEDEDEDNGENDE